MKWLLILQLTTGQSIALPVDSEQEDLMPEKPEHLVASYADATQISMPKRVTWAPQPDITAHELALALSTLLSMAHGLIYAEDAVAALPDNVSRHFRVGE